MSAQNQQKRVEVSPTWLLVELLVSLRHYVVIHWIPSKFEPIAENQLKNRQDLFVLAHQYCAKETFLSLYKGLGAVVIGIVPKMALRFSSYEFYRVACYAPDGSITLWKHILAGVGAGITEAVLVVNPWRW